MNRKEKAGAVVLTSSIAGIAAQTFATAQTSAASIGDVMDIKVNITKISTNELDELEKQINDAVGKLAKTHSRQRIKIIKNENCLEIGLTTVAENMKDSDGPNLRIDISSGRPNITFRKNSSSEAEKINSYFDLTQKLGHILRKFDKSLFAVLEKNPYHTLNNIKLVKDNPLLEGHPLAEILEFLDEHKDTILAGTSINMFGRNKFRGFKYYHSYDSVERPYSIQLDMVYHDLKYYSEEAIIGILNKLLASKYLKVDYRLKIREDDSGQYRLALYKGEPSDDTYVGDIKNEEGLKFLKEVEVPEAKKYITYREENHENVRNLLEDYAKKHPDQKKLGNILKIISKNKENLYLEDENVENNYNQSYVARLYYIDPIKNRREYILEPEDVEKDVDVKKIRETIINTINKKYEQSSQNARTLLNKT